MSTNCLNILLVANEEAVANQIRALLAAARRQKYHLEWMKADQLHAAPDLSIAMAANQSQDTHTIAAILVDSVDGTTQAALLNKLSNLTDKPPVVLLDHPSPADSVEGGLPAGAADRIAWQELSTPLLEHVIRHAVEAQQTRREQDTRLREMQETIQNLRHDLKRHPPADTDSQRLVQELKNAQQVTERAALEARHAAREARTAATRLEAIINSLTDAVFVYDHQGNVQLANSFAIAILGFDPMRMPRATLLRRVQIKRRDGTAVNPDEMTFNRAEKGELVFHDPITLTNSRGRSYSLLSSALPFFIGREFNGVVVVWTDVSRLERLQEEIRQKSKDLQVEQIEHRTQVEVQRQLIHHREMERIQIARDLHDTVLQNLIAFNFALVQAMEMNTKLERMAKLRWLQESLTKEIRDVRSYCNDLRPPVLAPFGLEKAIRSHLEGLKERHPQITIEADLVHDGKRLSEDVRMALYRVYQELVNNVIKHSHASVMHVGLQIDEQMLTLEITDDGIGFNIPSNWVDTARQGHLGIIGARERAESIGGTFDIVSNPGAGSRITLRLPLTP